MAGLLFGLMALDAKLVHDLFGDQLPFFFEPINGILLLWEKGVANIAVTQFVLMPMVGKMNHAALTAIQSDFFGPFVFNCRDAQSNGQYQNEGNHYNAFHQRLLVSFFQIKVLLRHFTLKKSIGPNLVYQYHRNEQQHHN
jgi:hypothetical protein